MLSGRPARPVQHLIYMNVMLKKKKNQINTLFVLFLALMLYSVVAVAVAAGNALVNSGTLPDGTPIPPGSIVVSDYTIGDNTDVDTHRLQGSVDGVEALAYPSVGTICFVPDDGQTVRCGNFLWSQVCIVLHYFSLFVAGLLGLLCAVSYYRSIMRQDKLNSRYIGYMSWVGLSIIISAIFWTLSVYLRSLGVRQMFAAADGRFPVQFEVDSTRLFFGIGLLFLAMALRATLNYQEEQELTI